MKNKKLLVYLITVVTIAFVTVINFNKILYTNASDALLTATPELNKEIYMPLVRHDPPIYTHIVFDSMRNGQREIYIMHADGSSQTRLTNHPWMDFEPDVSPDGQRIAFWTQQECGCPPEIRIMNIDGTNLVPLVTTVQGIWSPDWSPGGERIAVVTSEDGQLYIYVINADGSNPTRLTQGSSPDWSPDGSRILFSHFGISVMNSDGGNRTYVTSGSYARWLPDGEYIGFVSADNPENNNEIYVIDVDGSNIQRLTYTEEREFSPAWSPDGTKVTFVACRQDTTPAGQTCDVYVMNSDGSERMRLTDSRSMGASEGDPVWSP